MNALAPLVALLGALVTGLLIGGTILGIALWRLGQRFKPLEDAVVQTAQALNEHLGAPRVSIPASDVPDAFSVDEGEAREFLHNWSRDSRPWEDS